MGTQEARTQFESFVNSEGCKALAYVNQWQAAKNIRAFQSYVAACMKTGRLPETIQKTQEKRVPARTVRRAESLHADQSYAPTSRQGKEIERKRILPKQEAASANQSRGKNAPLSHERKLEDEKKQAQNRMDEAQKKYNKINKKVLNQLYSGNADSRMIEQAKDTSHKQIQKVKEAQKELVEAKEGVKDARRRKQKLQHLKRLPNP